MSPSALIEAPWSLPGLPLLFIPGLLTCQLKEGPRQARDDEADEGKGL